MKKITNVTGPYPTDQAGPRFSVRRDEYEISYDDGTTASAIGDTVVRADGGTDAVAVIVHQHAHPSTADVLLRRMFRPAAVLRRTLSIPCPEAAPAMVWETPAGKLERGDHGRRGVCLRAQAELLEETGYDAPLERFTILGAPQMASGGYSPEKLWFVAVDVTDLPEGEPTTDGSVFEVGCWNVWHPVTEALLMCERGEVYDAKTELGLRRYMQHYGLGVPRRPVGDRAELVGVKTSALGRCTLDKQPGVDVRVGRVFPLGGGLQAYVVSTTDTTFDVLVPNVDAGRGLAFSLGGHLRTPDGRIDNCAEAVGFDASECQVCQGSCPDRTELVSGTVTGRYRADRPNPPRSK